MTRLTVLTQSSLGTLQSCEERYRLRYIEGLVPMQERPHLSIGSAVHKGLEEHDPEAGVRLLREKRGPAWSDREREEQEVDAEVVRAMVEGALRHWTVWPETVEHAFALPVINPATGGRSTTHTFSGVQDGLWVEEDRLLEIKTSSRIDRDYIARLDIDWQVTSYLAAATELLGRPILQVVYRIIRKPTIRQHQGESDVEYLVRCDNRAPLAPLKQRASETDLEYAQRSEAREEAREPLKRRVRETPTEYGERVRRAYSEQEASCFVELIVTRTVADLRRWREEVWSLHKRILALEGGPAKAGGSFPIRNTRACLAVGRCDYFDLCTGQVGPESFRVQDAHPELPRQLTLNGERA